MRTWTDNGSIYATREFAPAAYRVSCPNGQGICNRVVLFESIEIPEKNDWWTGGIYSGDDVKSDPAAISACIIASWMPALTDDDLRLAKSTHFCV